MEVDLGEEHEGRHGQQEFQPLVTPYSIREHDYPHYGTLEEQFMFLLRYAILAPSGHNTQPWKFALTSAGIGIYADYTRRLPVADPDNRELLMSVGAALMNLRVAAAHFGFECVLEYNYSGDSERPLVFARLSPRASRDRIALHLDSLFPAIVRRHTNRHPFLQARVPNSVVNALKLIGESTQVGLLCSVDGALNMKVADMVAAADKKQYSGREFRKELAEWVRPNWTRKGDGITGAAIGVNGIASALGPWATRQLDLGSLRAAKDRNLCAQAPLLSIIYCEDTVPQLLEAGEFLERLFLTTTLEGLHLSFFNMPIELSDIRLAMRRLLSVPSWPQLLLRIGYSLEDPAPTPRRPVEECIITTRGRPM